MQFSMIALFAVVAGVAMASPMSLHQIRDCDLTSCAIALGGTGVACVSAGVEVGANPIADAGCVAGVLNNVVNTPASCSACASELGITQKIGGAVDDIEDVFGDVVDDVTSAVGDIF